MKNQEFIQAIGQASQEYYNTYKILPSLTIAQAILESGWGKTGLAITCHNYFGMKWTSSCGTDYKLYKTTEHKKDGTPYTITSKFRKYPTLQAGIKGYYDFLNYKRYANLKGVTDYKQACKLIKEDGWATDVNYTNKLIHLIEKHNLTQYDKVCISSAIQLPDLTGYKGISIVEALKSKGYSSSFENRKLYALQVGIQSYKGSAEQNKQLITKLGGKVDEQKKD